MEAEEAFSAKKIVLHKYPRVFSVRLQPQFKFSHNIFSPIDANIKTKSIRPNFFEI